MALSDEKIRRLIELTWNVAIESTFVERMRLITDAFRELVPYDALSAAIFDPGTVTAAPSSGSAFKPTARLFEITPERHLFSDRFPLEAMTRYATDYMRFDPITPKMLAKPGTPLLLSDVVPDERWGEEPFTREFLPSVGLRYAVGTVIPVDSRLSMTFGPWRSARGRDFTKADVRIVRLFQPIIARATFAALLSEKLAAPEGPESGERAPTGFALFGAAGALVRADAGARAFLASLGREPYALDKLTSDVAAAAAASTSDELIERTFPLGENAALRVRFVRVAVDGGAVAAIFQELALGDDPAFGAAAARVGLSARECEIAELVIDGRGNKEIAFKLDVSLETVKSHLKNVFRKAGVSGRTELASVLLGKARERAPTARP